MTDFFSPETPGGWQRRLRLDAALLLLVFSVMADRLTENPVHEVLSLVLGLLALLHLAVNRRWYTRLFSNTRSRRRKKSLSAWAGRALTLLLTASFAGSFISGVAVSQTVFSSVTPLSWQSDLTMRSFHVALSVIFFLLFGLHAGVKREALFPALKTLYAKKSLVLFSLLVALGLFAFLHRGFPGLLTFECAFIEVGRDEPSALMLVDFVLVFLGCLGLTGLAGVLTNLTRRTKFR